MVSQRKAHVDYFVMYEIFAYDPARDEWFSTNMRYSFKAIAELRAIQIYPDLKTKVEAVYDRPM